jgi:hypothetical protein
MPGWAIAVVVQVVLAVAAIAAQFYFKWVPDVETQKRHMKWAAWWLLDIASVASIVAAAISLVRDQGPITRSFVLGSALVASVGCFTTLTIVFRRFVLGGLTDKQLKVTGKLVEIVTEQTELDKQFRYALCLLANDPRLSDETSRAVQKVLSIKRAAPAVPALGSEVDSSLDGSQNQNGPIARSASRWS